MGLYSEGRFLLGHRRDTVEEGWGWGRGDLGGSRTLTVFFCYPKKEMLILAGLWKPQTYTGFTFQWAYDNSILFPVTEP